LAVHPEFGGKGIASCLVKWGLEQCERVSLPAYVEATPVAVGLYKRLGFVELRTIEILDDPEYHLTALLKMPHTD
jgi:ribosomal protein S18 acetylase RimI-like enzyme